jgi:hypothetical protein
MFELVLDTVLGYTVAFRNLLMFGYFRLFLGFSVIFGFFNNFHLVKY